jgi:hypothetical protein
MVINPQQFALVFRDDPHGMDYARYVTQDRKQNVDPKLLADAYLQEYAQGREKYRDNDAEQIHRRPLSVAHFLPDTAPEPTGCRLREYPLMLRVRIEPCVQNTNILGPLERNMIHNVFHA